MQCFDNFGGRANTPNAPPPGCAPAENRSCKWLFQSRSYSVY